MRSEFLRISMLVAPMKSTDQVTTKPSWFCGFCMASILDFQAIHPQLGYNSHGTSMITTKMKPVGTMGSSQYLSDLLIHGQYLTKDTIILTNHVFVIIILLIHHFISTIDSLLGGWFTTGIVKKLSNCNPKYNWTNPTYPTYNWG